MPNPSSIRAEVKEFRRYWRSQWPEQSSLNLCDCLQRTDVEIFPNKHTLLRIGCILPVGSCEAERLFFCLLWIKTRLRNKMGSDRLSGIRLMSMHHSMHMPNVHR